MAKKSGRGVPDRLKSYWTFRNANVLAAALAVWNLAFMMFLKPGRVPPQTALPRSWEVVVYSRAFLIPYNIALALGFCIIFATRKNIGYYRLRVLFYGMLLGGVTGELVHFFVQTLLPS
jgi:hypothetical protein